MFMLRSTHETEINIQAVRHRIKMEIDAEINQRTIDANRVIIASLVAENNALRPLADKYRDQLRRDREYQANKKRARK